MLLIFSIIVPSLPDMNDTQVLLHWRKCRSAIPSGAEIYIREVFLEFSF